MRRTIITVLGVMTAIAGLASSAQAQSTQASNSATGEFTSDGSLMDISSRTVDNDFNRFFLGTAPPPALDRTGTIPNIEEIDDNLTPRQQLGVLQIRNDMQLISNNPIYAPITRVPGQENLPFNNAERVRFQIELGQ